MRTTAKKQERNTAFDFLKVFFLLLIILQHCAIMDVHLYSYLGVDMFFMISGYLLYRSFERSHKNGLFAFIKHRIKRLHPQYALAFVLLVTAYLVSGKGLDKTTPIGLVYELFMLQSLGLPFSGRVNYPCWYISVLFISTILLCVIWHVIQSKKIRQYLHICTALVLYTLLLINNSTTLEQWSKIGGLFPCPVLRGLAGMSAGAFLSQIETKPSALRYLDLPVFLLVFAVMFTHISEYAIIAMIVCMVYFASFENSALDWIGKYKPVQFLIKYEYTMYLNHALIISTLSTLFKDKIHPAALGTMIVISIIVFSVCLNWAIDIFKEKIAFKKTQPVKSN